MTYWVAGAVVGSAVIGSQSASSAADAQAGATAEGIAEQRRQFDTTRGDYAPQRNAGNWALQQLLGSAYNPTSSGGPGAMPQQSRDNFDGAAYLAANPDVAAAGVDPWRHYIEFGKNENREYKWTPAAQAAMHAPATTGGGAAGTGDGELSRSVTAADVMSDPGYQFGLDQGQQALDRKVAAMGGRVSGAALKASARFATGAATTGYNAAYQRRQDRLNRLQQLAGYGQTATGASAAAGATATGAISDMITAQGNAAGGAQLAQGNIWANAGNQIASLYGRNRSPATPPVGVGSDPYGFNGTQNNPSAYVGGG